MEGLIFVIIAGLISMFFRKDKNKDEQKTAAHNKQEQQVKRAAKQTKHKVMQAPVQNASLSPDPDQRPVQKRETKQLRPKKPVSQPMTGVEKWSEQDFLKGIILSEVLGPPKSKRKK